MAPRIRPATTLAVVLGIAFAFQLIAILSVPVTKTITLCTYDGYKFGVFGLCQGDKCSSVGIGYSDKDIDDVDGFSLPSNARHSVSKLLVVHPIAAGFSLILLLSSLLLHWHGPSNSLRFLFFLLLWTIPSFLISLLSFLVDILLFVPHLDWGGWIVLAATVLIAVSGVLLCIMRRTVSSRRALKRKDAYGNDYQLEPLNYGYGTMDGNSDVKLGSNSYDGKDDQDDGQAPFVHDGDEYAFDNTVNLTRSHENLNTYPSTQILDTMRAGSGQSNSTGYRSPENVLAPLSTAYRGGFDFDPTEFEPTAPEQNTITAPYPTDIQNADFEEPSTNTSAWKAPYPSGSQPAAYNSNSAPHIGSKPSGPRPMPTTAPKEEELPLLPSEIAAARAAESNSGLPPIDSPSAPLLDEENQSTQNIEAETSLPIYAQGDTLAPPALVAADVTREPTYRTKIANTLDQLQGSESTREPTYRTKIANGIDQLQDPQQLYSNPSFIDTNESLLASRSGLNVAQIPEGINEHDDDEEELYGPATTAKPVTSDIIESEQEDSIPDNASSNYSSHIPSTVTSPIDPSFSRGQSFLRPNRGASSSAEDYPFPDPHERRVTPAPSFSNISLVSSNFTSVSQRGINPKYLENNPDEQDIRSSQKDQVQLSGRHQGSIQTRPRPMQSAQNTTDILIASNPDFSVLPLNPKNGRKRMGR